MKNTTGDLRHGKKQNRKPAETAENGAVLSAYQCGIA